MRLILLVLTIMICLSGCREINARQSVKLNDLVIHHQKELMKSLTAYINALEEKNADQITVELNNLKEYSKSGLMAINSISPSDCDSEFIPAAKKMFSYYVNASRNECVSIGDLYAKDSLSYEAFDSLKVLVESFRVEQGNANTAFLNAQKEFARKCNFKLVQNEN